jgi:uncharacterized protein (TIGR02996 family)
MNQEEAFLQAILEHPDDDAPRLVYADWLDEQGDAEQAEQAAFTRAQVRRARLPPDDPEVDELRRRGGYLLARQQALWRARLRTGPAELKLVRGLVEGVQMPASGWLRHGKRLRAATPLRRVKLTEVKESLAALLKSPTLEGLEHLDLNGNDLGDEGVRALAECPHLSGLKGLHLNRNKVGDAGVQALAADAYLASLTFLELSGNEIGDEGARALAESPHLTRLRELHLGSNKVGDAGARALAASAHLAGLAELVLYVNEIGAAGARALVGSPYLQKLGKLYLNQNRLSAATRKALEQSWGERISCSPGR